MVHRVMLNLAFVLKNGSHTAKAAPKRDALGISRNPAIGLVVILILALIPVISMPDAAAMPILPSAVVPNPISGAAACAITINGAAAGPPIEVFNFDGTTLNPTLASGATATGAPTNIAFTSPTGIKRVVATTDTHTGFHVFTGPQTSFSNLAWPQGTPTTLTLCPEPPPPPPSPTATATPTSTATPTTTATPTSTATPAASTSPSTMPTTSSAAVGPAVVIVAPTPDPIVGPLASGRVSARASGNQVSLVVPPSLSVWFNRSVNVNVGSFSGPLPSSGIITVTAPNEGQSLTLSARLITDAPYTESIDIESPSLLTPQRTPVPAPA